MKVHRILNERAVGTFQIVVVERMAISLNIVSVLTPLINKSKENGEEATEILHLSSLS